MKRGFSVLLLAGFGLAAVAEAQLPLPLGLQQLVNLNLLGDQDEPDVALDGQGNVIVVYRDSFLEGSLSGIYARRFVLLTGEPLGEPTLINFILFGDQRRPAVAAAPDGHYVVIWETPEGGGIGLKGSLRAPNGNAIVEEFPINQTTAGSQRRPAVAMQPNGAFLVTWQSDQPIALRGGSSGENIFGRLFPATFPVDPPSNEQVLNTIFIGDQEEPEVVAMAGNGGWLVGWQGPLGPSQIPSILVRPLNNSGTGPPELPANSSSTAIERSHVSLAANAQGQGVAVWEAQEGTATQFRDIFSRRLDFGVPFGSEEPVNLSTDLDEREPTVAIDERGGFVTTWIRAAPDFSPLPEAPDGSPIIIQGRRKASGGGFAEAAGAGDPATSGPPAPDGEFQVNSSGADFSGATVASQPEGNFVVVWGGTDLLDLEGLGTYMRRFADALFADGFESGDHERWSDQAP